MKKIMILILLIISIAGQAQAAIFWNWDLYTKSFDITPLSTTWFYAYLENLGSPSDGNITRENMGYASITSWGTPGLVSFPQPNLFAQFNDMNLAPGERFDFVFGKIDMYNYPSWVQPNEWWKLTFELGLREADPEGIEHEIRSTPEPASLVLLGAGLVGLLRLRRKFTG